MWHFKTRKYFSKWNFCPLCNDMFWFKFWQEGFWGVKRVLPEWFWPRSDRPFIQNSKQNQKNIRYTSSRTTRYYIQKTILRNPFYLTEPCAIRLARDLCPRPACTYVYYVEWVPGKYIQIKAPWKVRLKFSKFLETFKIQIKSLGTFHKRAP